VVLTLASLGDPDRDQLADLGVGVNNGKCWRGALGYYLNPLVNVLMGTLLLKESSAGANGRGGARRAGVAVLAWGAAADCGSAFRWPPARDLRLLRKVVTWRRSKACRSKRRC
jgi:hypothetical protein